MKNNKENYSILVVDDQDQNRRILKNIISHAGYKVADCASGPEALNLLNVNKYDVVVIDYNMPEMNGPQTVKNIRKIKGSEAIKIIMVTATNDSESVKKAIKAGIQGYILKPIKIYEVLSKLSAILQIKETV